MKFTIFSTSSIYVDNFNVKISVGMFDMKHTRLY